MNAELKDFFSAIGKAKKEKEDEVRSLVGEIDIDSMFSQVKVSIEEDNKKKEQCTIQNVIVRCPECGCDYTYDIGYGVRECFDCLNTFKSN